MSRAKYQHYVSCFYLKKFCNSEGKVWVYDKHLNKAYCRKPNAIGGETYFYDAPEIEKQLGVEQVVEKFFHPFEGKAASVINTWLSKLDRGMPFRIHRKQREFFAFFLATQLVRTPSHRDFIMQWGAAMKKIELNAYLQAKLRNVSEQDVKITWDKEREPYLHAERILDTDALTRYARILGSHLWIVISNPTRHTLYTSDNPVSRKVHKSGGWRSYSGIASEGIQLIFPLSPRFSLSLLERTRWKNFAKFDGKLGSVGMVDENVEHDNSGQVLQSTRFVYCQEDDFSLARLVCADFPEVTDPKRQLVSQD
jgi:hypothetical protein